MNTEQRDIANLGKLEPNTADPKPKDSWLPIPDAEQRDKQRDLGGNVIPDRVQANLDRYKDGPEHD